MAIGHVFIGVSLDGYIARANGDIDWLVAFASMGEDYGYDRFIARMDCLIMGRGTYEAALTFDGWQYDKPVIVLSRNLSPSSIPPHLVGKVEFFSGTSEEALAHAASKGWQHAYVDGGKTIQSFLRAGLIEDMVVSHLPILIGDGLPLFGPLERDVELELLGSYSLPSGMVQSTYKVRKS